MRLAVQFRLLILTRMSLTQSGIITRLLVHSAKKELFILVIYSSFQMTVESNYVIAIATLSDWLKRLPPVFQPMRSKTKTNCAMYA